MASPTSSPSRRRLLWPAVTAGLMLAITLSLGVWQIERLHWKQGLLAEIDRAEAASPVPLSTDPVPFQKVEVTGTVGQGEVRYGTEVRGMRTGAVLGSQVVVPLLQPGRRPLLVDLGWLPDAAVLPKPAGTVTLTGYVRPPERPGAFAPGPDLAHRRFWSLDPAAMAAALGLPAVAPYTVVVLGPESVTSTSQPMPAQALPRPPNDHLGYAVTWFGLSACLLVVFVLFVRSSLHHERV